MADTPSIKVIKQITWRGGQRLFSNRYHFTGGIPADNTKWTTFCDNVAAAEKAIYGNPSDFSEKPCLITEIIGYDAGSDLPVFSKSYSAASTGTFSSFGYTESELVALARFSTDARTTKNHPVYLFNYFHAALAQLGTGGDNLNNSQKTAIQGYLSSWVSGFTDGAVVHKRAGPRGAVALGYFVDGYLHHRDFPR